MGKGTANLRFAVADPHIGHSCTWRLWATRHGDVYLANYRLAGTLKLSFHRSGICRYAFTKEHGPGHSMTDRVIQRWNRAAVPAANTGQFCRLAWIAFPTDYLSKAKQPGLEAAVHFPPAPSGKASFVEVGLCKDSREFIEGAMSVGSSAGIVLHSPMIDDTSLLVRWHHGDWDNGDIHMPASLGKPAYRFSAIEAEHPDRPVRLVMNSNPKDGDAILITELGGGAGPR